MSLETHQKGLLKALIVVLVLGINLLGLHRQACAVSEFQALAGQEDAAPCHGDSSKKPEKPSMSSCCLEELNTVDSTTLNTPALVDLPLIFSAQPPIEAAPQVAKLSTRSDFRGPPLHHQPPLRDLLATRLN